MTKRPEMSRLMLKAVAQLIVMSVLKTSDVKFVWQLVIRRMQHWLGN